jgi:FKBP-type peptidyl-prolyl cis-trans isomerase FklB
LDNKQPQISIVEMRSAMVSMQQKIEAQRAAQADKAKAAGEAFLAANKGKAGVITLSSGIQYKIIKTGSGKQPKAEDNITAHYEGTLINGKIFDSSYQRGTPATFSVNQVIPGWQEILQLMHEGDKWQVFIPAHLAYGERGAGQDIGPNEALIFDIELISVN